MRPTHDDPLARSASEGIGGPSGARSAGHPWWTPLRVVLALTCVGFLLAMVQKTPCVQEDWTGESYRYAALCYSDVPYLYVGRGFAERSVPFSDTGGRWQVMEYPVVIGYFAYGTALVTQALSGWPDVAEREALPADSVGGAPGVLDESHLYFQVTAVLLAGFALLAAWFLARTHRGRPWDAALFALSPALVLTGLVNWDLLAVTAVAGALWAWSRDRPLLSGRPHRDRHGHQALPAVPARCAARGLPAPAADGRPSPPRPWRRSAPGCWPTCRRCSTASTSGRCSGRSTTTAAPTSARSGWSGSRAGTTVTAQGINLSSWIWFGAVCVAVLTLGLLAPRTPRIPQLAFLIVVGFLLVNKVYSPQYVLWLLPLAVLARPRWRDLLIWQAGEAIYFVGVWFYLGGFTAAATSGQADHTYWLTIGVRIAAELWLAGVIVRDILVPWRDPVRADGLTDDPMEPTARYDATYSSPPGRVDDQNVASYRD